MTLVVGVCHYSVIDGLYAAKKLMIKYVEAHGKNETN